jgi:arylsulfatase A-like enzyme
MNSREKAQNAQKRPFQVACASRGSEIEATDGMLFMPLVRRFLRRASMALLVFSTLTALFLALESQAAAGKPNILVILADDLGYGELSCQGNPQVKTPHIDSLARSGIRFTSGYVSGPYCSPTRAGLMTGRYQQRFGHEFNPGPAQAAPVTFGLPLQEKTIGDRFKALGYATGWFGKSHLGYEPQFHPLRRGFDEYFGFLGGAHSYLDAGADRGNPILRGTNRVPSVDYTTDEFAREAAAFIEKHRSEPWLCYLPFNAVHAPLQSTEKYLAKAAGISDPQRKTFAAMLTAMDEGVGLVLAKIKQHNLEQDTLIFFFSDNGGPTRQTTSGNGPLRGFKAQTWEGGIRVPFIIQWKGHLPAGVVEDRPVIQLDLLPTALAAAGAAIDPGWKLDGVNLLPYLAGGKAGLPHEVLFWRFGQQIALRKDNWKLVKGAGGTGMGAGRKGRASTEGAELYDLRADIGENENLATQRPEKLKELSADWDRLNSQMIDPLWGGAAQGAKAVKAKQGRKAKGP